MRRLRARPRQPDLRGPRETPPGPTTWVRPATGWWERMNAGETPRNQGCRRGAPVRFQKAVPRSKEKRRGGAPRGAPVRVMGRQFPPAGGTGLAVRQAMVAAFRDSEFRRSATLCMECVEGTKPTTGTESQPGCAGGNDGARLNTCMEKECRREGM